MRVKLRAGTHFAPLPQGVYVAGATGPAFVLTGPPVLYQVLDSQVGLLCAGTDTDALVAALGGEAARPVLDRVLRTLVDRDILLDLDGLGTPPPDGATADRYAEVLSYLEAHCAEPYKVFAQVQAATVAVLGGGPAAGVLERTLRRYGIGRVVVLPTGQPVPVRPDVVVLLDDPDSPLDALAYSRSRPDDAVTVVTAREAVALVGAGLVGPAGMAGFLALAGRAEGWAVVEPDLAAPRPLSAVLAGSLAAHAVLRHLIGGDLPPATPGGDLPPATPGGDAPPAALGGDA
ncbi:MAG TPA: hypothetical protein VHA75_05790, partial [Rugosimonospora sp.]|nr:hypothetical protein [Rugosimonospora sp.]